MKIICVLSALLLMFVLAACASASDIPDDAIKIDVRTPSEFASGHIPGAINVPLDVLADKIAQIAPDLQQPIVVYCRSGARSAAAAQLLTDLGYENVTDIGGIIDWTGEVVTTSLY